MIDERLPKVAVLLAAYNGMEWIEEQVESILKQKEVFVSIYISVDLSSDGTYEWCQKLAVKNLYVNILPGGEHFGGAAKNFLRLIRDVDSNHYDYISLSDQDDIWLSNKLIQAISTLKTSNAEAYSSDVTAFWSDNKRRLVKKSYPQKKYDYFFESAGPGCTYVFTCQSFQKLKCFFIENWDEVCSVESHDWLIYAFFRSRGMPWRIDNKSLMLYRQHGFNQVGSNFGLLAYLKRIKMIKNGWYRSEVKKISDVIDTCDAPVLNLERQFLVKNFYHLRRRSRDVLILLLMILFRVF